jgi:RNA polymerase sigma factor (sigma-70 family)
MCGDHHAADDCFQAVFLVLVRRARTLRVTGSLGPWLFEVARRVCLQAKTAKVRRRRCESCAAKGEAGTTSQLLDDEARATVHHEVGLLPRNLRAPVVLCDLAGLSYDEAAERLGLSRSTLRGRLARGRERLRTRLERRGFKPEGVGALAVAVPASLAGATAEAAEILSGRAAGTVPALILELANGGLQSMVMTKLKAAGLSALAGVVLIAGALGLGAQTDPSRTPAPGANPYATVEYATIFTAATDDSDPSDEVAALVRKAQRQQDRGDVAAARKTLGQVDAALKQWAARLRERPVPPAPAGGSYNRNPGSPATGEEKGSHQTGPLPPPGSTPPPGGNEPLGAPGVSQARQQDLERKLHDVEAKLDAVLKELAKMKRDGIREEKR